jgi:hypothetical protein
MKPCKQFDYLQQTTADGLFDLCELEVFSPLSLACSMEHPNGTIMLLSTT